MSVVAPRLRQPVGAGCRHVSTAQLTAISSPSNWHSGAFPVTLDVGKSLVASVTRMEVMESSRERKSFAWVLSRRRRERWCARSGWPTRFTLAGNGAAAEVDEEGIGVEELMAEREWEMRCSGVGVAEGTDGHEIHTHTRTRTRPDSERVGLRSSDVGCRARPSFRGWVYVRICRRGGADL